MDLNINLSFKAYRAEHIYVTSITEFKDAESQPPWYVCVCVCVCVCMFTSVCVSVWVCLVQAGLSGFKARAAPLCV